MSKVFPGKIVSDSIVPIEFSLNSNQIIIWRESLKAEAVLCEDPSHIPKYWLTDMNTPLKILGNFGLIKKMFPKFLIPQGSKVVGLQGNPIIRMNFLQKSIQFSGIRIKRIVLIDDSATIRKLLRHFMSQYENWEVVGESANAEGINELIENTYPDLATLDLNLGEINGAIAMKRYLAPKRIPTLIITSQALKDGSLVMEALHAGALDYLQKPESGKWELLKEEMLLKMEAALKSKWQNTEKFGSGSPVKQLEQVDIENFLIVIGSSTGGTQALEEIFTRLPEKIPPILVTQHIPAGFSKALAERLNKLCPFEIKEAEDGDEVRIGRVLIAPGDHHMKLKKGGRVVEVLSAEPVNRFRPSVDVLFRSVAANAKSKVIAAILTGMGKDGAEGMLELKISGAMTVAQDEDTSVVFGMPKEAIRIGAADEIKPLTEIPSFFYECMTKKRNIKTKV